MVLYSLATFFILSSLLVQAYGDLISAPQNADPVEKKQESNCSQCDCVQQTADCSSRNLQTLPQDLPSDITTLNLFNNSIEHLPDGLLGQLYKNLEVLNINLNKIAVFGNSTFIGLENMQNLTIGNNPFKPELLHPLVYKPLMNIHSIIVNNHGKESKLPSRIPLFNAFEGLQNSTIKVIVYKHITLMPFLLEKRFLRYLKHCHLKRLDLSDNGIFAVEPGYSTYLSYLEYIDLSGSVLGGVTRRSNPIFELYFMRYLKVIKIENNLQHSIQNYKPIIPFSKEMSEIEWAFPVAITELYLTKTSLDWAPYYLPYGVKVQPNNNLKMVEGSASFIFKHIDGAFKGFIHLEKFIYRDNTCIFTPEFFTCETGYFESLQHLDLANNRVKLSGSNSSHQLFKNCSQLRHIDVSYNAITDIHTDAFVDTRGLEVLNLSGNKIEQIVISIAELKYLRLLNLSNNLIRFIEENTRKEIEEVIQTSKGNLKLDIQKNPLICNCDSFKFIEWMQKHSDNIHSWQDVTCISTNGSEAVMKDIILPKMKWNCWKTFILPSVISFGLTVLGSVAVLCIYKRRYKIQYLGLLLRALLRRNQQTDFVFDFDGFMSYSSLDKNWALINVYAPLANEYNYNICVDDRNFMPGAYIADIIIESISKSNKIILIISQNFLRSGWCTFEMNLARGELATRGRDCLILILKEPTDVLPPELITPTLRSLLETRVYLEWSENKDRKQLFWRKMRDALGDPRYKGEEDTRYICQANDGDDEVLQELLE